MADERLAIHGGGKARPVADTMRIVSPGVLAFDHLETDAVVEVLKRGIFYRHWGSEVASFEREFAQRVGSRFAVALNSGTSALLGALAAIGVKPGDEVIVPCYAFAGVAAVVLACGARAVCCEIDDTFTLSVSHVRRIITPRTKAIIAAHMRGSPCDMKSLSSLCKEFNLSLIEDVAQSCGGSFDDVPLGRFGNIGCYSLQQFKVITTGEGGVCVTDDEELYRRLLFFHDAAAYWSYTFRPTNYTVPSTGLNLRMSEIEGAIGRVQLRKLDGIIERLRAVKTKLEELTADVPGCRPQRYHDARGTVALVLLLIIDSRLNPMEIESALRAEGIIGSLLQPPGQRTPQRHICQGWGEVLGSASVLRENECASSCELLTRTLQIQIHPNYQVEDLQEIAHGLAKVFRYYVGQ